MENISKNLSEIEEKYFNMINDSNLNTGVRVSREFCIKIWENTPKKIISDYTDHGFNHSVRILNIIDDLLNHIPDNYIKGEYEIYLLLCSIYLHDIGMQCDIANEITVKDLSRTYGADYKENYEKSNENGYTKPQQNEIRFNHHLLTAAYIKHLYKNSQFNFNLIHKDFIEDLIDICKYHSKLSITECKEYCLLRTDVKKRFIACLLRLGDELDIDTKRVDIDTIKLTPLSVRDKSFWHIHDMTIITIKGKEIIFKIKLSEKDYNNYKNDFEKKIISDFQSKNQNILNELSRNNLPLIISENSSVVKYDTQLDLPNEIISYVFPDLIKTDSINRINNISNENLKNDDENLYDDISEIEYEKIRKEMQFLPEIIAFLTVFLGDDAIQLDMIKQIIPNKLQYLNMVDCCIIYETRNDKVFIKFKDIEYKNFLAARVLALQKIDIIKDVLFISKKDQKVNPFWYSSLIYFINIYSKKQIIDLIIKHEPELFLKSEGKRVEENKRYEIFQKIFNDYIQKKLWITRATKFDPNDLAKFGDTENNVDYLINILKDKVNKPHYTTMYNALILLRSMDSAKKKANELETILLDIILNFSERKEMDINKTALMTFTDLKLNTNNNIDKILDKYKDSDNSWIRYGLYYMLVNSDYLDENIIIFLDGIKYLGDMFNEDIEKIRLGDESHWLWEGLKKINNINSIKEVLKYFINLEENKYHQIEFKLRDYFKEVVENLISNYQKDNSIYNDVIDLCKKLEKVYLQHYTNQLKKFFIQTGTLDKAFQYFYNLSKEDGNCHPYLNTLATLSYKSNCEFLLNEYRNKNFIDGIGIFRNLLGSYNPKLYDWFADELEKISEGKIKKPIKRDYDKENKEALEKYIKILFDNEKYKLEIKKILSLFQEDIIEDDFDKLYEAENKFNSKIDNIRDVFEDFKWIFLNGERINKDEINILLNDDNRLNYLFIKRSYELLSGKEDNLKYFSEDQIEKIKEFCFKTVKRINFKIALKKTDKGSSTDFNAIYIFYFMKKFNIEFSKEIILDTISFSWLDSFGLNNFYSIEYLDYYLKQKIISVDDLKERILENIRDKDSNLNIDIILIKHIKICEKYKLFNKEITDYLRDLIITGVVDSSTRKDCLKVYYDYSFNDNSKETINSLFTEITDDFKWELCDFLLKKESLVKILNEELLLNILNDDKSTNEDKLKSFEYLINYDNLKGIDFYIDNIIKTKKFTGYSFNWSSCLYRIRIKEVVPKLLELLLLDYKKEIEYDDYVSLFGSV